MKTRIGSILIRQKTRFFVETCVRYGVYPREQRKGFTTLLYPALHYPLIFHA